MEADLSHNTLNTKREIKALKVNQWLKEWDKVTYDKTQFRSKPEDHFYLFTLPASDLRALAGINRRLTTDRSLGTIEIGIQRRHEPERSAEIGEYAKYGYPWSKLKESQRQSGEYNDLRKPGWLPTAIVVNILRKGDLRRGIQTQDADLIQVSEVDENNAVIQLPRDFLDSNWKPKGIPPLEVIDGQHRLWAFEQQPKGGAFELPVVAFYGLDISWQAYLFWTINIKPKRINQSLAFDLYPLLRTEDWLEKTDDLKVYRETRAQELVEVLWSYPGSPWHNHINMLGETGKKMVTQAAWIRALTATYVKAFEGRGTRIGGLFGARLGESRLALPWSRMQQAAFLVLVGQKLQSAILQCKATWAKELRKPHKKFSEDPAFYGEYSLLSTDQGIRGFLSITNDLCFVQAEQLKLEEWGSTEPDSNSDDSTMTKTMNSLKRQPVAAFIESVTLGLAKFDWRTSSEPSLSEDESIRKSALRGSGGYKLLRKQLLQLLANESGSVAKASKEVLGILGYE